MKKIAFWRTIGASYRFVFSDLRRFFRLSGIWIVGWTAIPTFFVLVFGAASIRFDPGGLQGMATLDYFLSSGSRIAYFVIIVVFGIVSLAAFSVACYRAVLLNEISAFGSAIGFGRREWRFFGYYLILFLVGALIVALSAVIVIVALLAYKILIRTGHAPLLSIRSIYGYAVLIFLIPALAMGFYSIRLSLGFPAIAVDEPKGVFRRAWRRGRGNVWRLSRGFASSVVPLAVLQGVANSFAHSLPVRLGWDATGVIAFMVATAVGSGLYFLMLATTAAFLSLSYRQLSDWDDMRRM